MKSKNAVTPIEQGKRDDARDTIVLHSIKVAYTKTYWIEVKFRASAFNGKSWAWLCEPLEELSRRTRLNPPCKDLKVLLRGLRIASRLPSWKSLIATPLIDVKLEQVIALYESFDAEVSTCLTFSSNAAARCSGFFRQFISNYLRLKTADSRLHRHRFRFISKLREGSEGRKLLSDFPDGGRPPLGAIQHLDIAELLRVQVETLRGDSMKILEVCVGVLKRHTLGIDELDRLSTTIVPAEAVEAILDWMGSIRRKSRVDPLVLPSDMQEHLLAMTVQMVKGLRPTQYPSKNNRRTTWTFPFLGSLVPMLTKRLYELSNSNSFSGLACMDIAPSSEALLACELILQLHTKWNFASVLALNVRDLEIVSFPHALQSVKTKTGDHTPIVFILASDTAAILACSVLRDRIRRLKLLGVRTDGERAIWAHSRSVLGTGQLSPQVNWSQLLGNFSQKYGLVRFSFEQLRVQRLSELHTETRSLANVRFEAGHAKEMTSMHYVDKLMLNRTNSAILLEFERRLDATVRYMIDPQSTLHSQRLIAYPLGDGTSCKSPTSPPEESWLIAGVCDGKGCNFNGGCPQRTIQVTKDRIEEVVLTKRFYERNWNRLLNENEAEFREYHEPGLLFNLAFYGLLRKGPYRHLVANCETKSHT